MTRPKAQERNLGNDDEQDPDESTGSERLKAVPVTAGQEDPALVPNLIDPGGRNVKRIPEAPGTPGVAGRNKYWPGRRPLRGETGQYRR